MKAWEINLNALIILILSGILLGAYGVQFFLKEEPCPLCMLQRIGMLLVASSLLLNIQFGIHTVHYGLALIASLVGGLVALRQISLHVCPGFDPPFGLPVLGLSLYTWSFIVFASVVLAISILLFLYRPGTSEKIPEKMNPFCKFSFGLIFFVAIANIVTTLWQCGLGACKDI